MNKKLLIVANYPQICQAIDVGAGLSQISDILLKTINEKITFQQLSKTIIEIKNKTVLKHTQKLILFYPFDDSTSTDYYDFATVKHGLWMAPVSALSRINNDWIITRDNISQLNNPIARILSKWILQEFDINNKYLLNGIEITEDQYKIINHVPDMICEFIKSSISIATDKYITWLFQNQA